MRCFSSTRGSHRSRSEGKVERTQNRSDAHQGRVGPPARGKAEGAKKGTAVIRATEKRGWAAAADNERTEENGAVKRRFHLNDQAGKANIPMPKIAIIDDGLGACPQ